MTYVLLGLGAAPRTAAQIAALRDAKLAELDVLLNQWNDAEFKNPPDVATQARLDPQIAALQAEIKALREEFRRLTGTKPPSNEKVVLDEIVIKGKPPTSILPWVVGGLAVALAIGAATRKKTSIAPT